MQSPILTDQGAANIPRALYVHIPFCAVRCTYCAFNIYAHAEALIPSYLNALCDELGWLSATALPLETVYLGGGTPSQLTIPQIACVLQTIRDRFEITADCEISMELNPGDTSAEYLAGLRQLGVNRLSIGMQSAQGDELALMHRDHTPDAVPRVVEMARSAGFENLNLDLIFGLPGQTISQWQENLAAALALTPDHLSLYSLELEPGTTLTREIRRGLLTPLDDDLTAEMYDLARSEAAQAGFSHYEISNWARPGHECRHNLHYWHNTGYLGVGAGAHGYAVGQRYMVEKSLRKYIACIASQSDKMAFPFTSAVIKSEMINHREAMLEQLFTGLRLVQEGVSIETFATRFGVSLESVYGNVLMRLESEGLLFRDANLFRLTPAAYMISNRVSLALIDEKN